VKVADDKGVPLRLELGPKDIQANSTLAVRRYDGKKWSIPIADIATAVSRLLEEIQNEMYSRALATQEERLVKVTNWDNLVPTLDAKNILVLPWCEEEQCEDDIKERSKSQYVFLSLSDGSCEL
jgi:prolyl-tRNA synthetase